jgi:hypothetical protein
MYLNNLSMLEAVCISETSVYFSERLHGAIVQKAVIKTSDVLVTAVVGSAMGQAVSHQHLTMDTPSSCLGQSMWDLW